MNLLREDNVYFAQEILPALMRAGQFPHVSRDGFQDALDSIYLDGTWGSNFGRKGYSGYHENTFAQGALIRAYRSRKTKEKTYDPYYATSIIMERFGCICVVCGNLFYNLGCGINGLQLAVCPSALFLSDKHNRPKFSIGGSLCSACSNLTCNRAVKYFSIKEVWEDESVPDRVWIEILSKIRKTPGTVKRIQENAPIWQTLRFDPRRKVDG